MKGGGLILQRVVPHYRRSIFERLYADLGLLVATSDIRQHESLSLIQDNPPWLRRFPFRFPSASKPYYAIVPLEEIIAQLDPTFIIAEFSLQMSSTYGLVCRRLFQQNPPFAFWSHGQNLERSFHKPVDLASQILRLSLMSFASAHLCYTNEGAAYLRRWLPISRPVFVAHNTITAAQSIAAPIANARNAPCVPRLLFVGRLTADKDIRLLIQAFRLLRRSWPAAQLDIVGDGPDRETLVRELNQCAGGIVYHGAIYDAETLSAMFNRATLFVYAGSTGLAVNQALCHGLPVAIFEQDSCLRHHPEHVHVVEGITGCRVSPRSPAALASALRSMHLGGNPRLSLAVPLRTYVDDHLGLESMLSGFRDLHAYMSHQNSAAS